MRVRRSAWAMVVALALLAAGCSSGDDRASDSEVTSTSTDTATTTTTTSTVPAGPCELAPDTKVSDVTFAELQRYELNNGEPVPTFAQYLDLANEVKVGVLPEIKYFPGADGGTPVPWTTGQLDEYRTMVTSRTNLSQVLIGSFQEPALAYFADNQPEWPRIWFRGIGNGDAFAPPTVDEMRTRAPSANALGVLNVLYFTGVFPADQQTYDVPQTFADAGIPVYVWFNVATGGDSADGGEPFGGAVASPGWSEIASIQPQNVDWIATDRPADYQTWSTSPAAPDPAPTMVAHRGGGEDGVSENSLTAFRKAIADGAEVLETDVQWTKPTPEDPNGVPVLMHDQTINRTARCRG